MRQLLAQEEKVTLTLAPTEIRPTKRVTVCVKESLEAIVQLDTRSLRTLLQDAWVDHGHHAVLAEVLSPLLQHIGALWRSGDMRIMHERLASSVIRPFLNELAETYPQADEAPSMVVATPVGENHEIGALMALAVAASEGWQCTYLGPDMPAREIADASHQIGADAVALSVVNPTVGPRVMSEINALRQLLSPKVQILAGGEGARAYQDFLKKLNVTHVVDLGHFQSMISQLVEA
ncbi:MAG: cobalamin-dependent protein [Acidobacteriota bacterium]